MRRSILTMVVLAATLWVSAAGAQQAAQQVVVNRQALGAEEIRLLTAVTGVVPSAGRYWYDGTSGLWGLEGQGTAGVLPPDLPVGGSLRADASNGSTGVFINGRQLTYEEVLYLSQIGPVYPMRYWLLADGTYGIEGMGAIGNLVAAAQAANGGQGGGGGWHSGATGASGGSSASGSYIMFDDGSSVSSF